MTIRFRFWDKIFIAAAVALAVVKTSVALAENVSIPPTSSDVCQPTRPHAAGLSEYQIESNGHRRRYLLYIPNSYTGKAVMPLILDLHASSITPEIELQITRMDRASEEKGFILALPEAVTKFARGGTTWNIPFEKGVDDLAFIASVLNEIHRTVCTDAEHTYAIGYSGGARLASQLACDLPNGIAAIGAVAGLRHTNGRNGDCQEGKRAVSIIAFHSLDDPVNPYKYDPAHSPPYWRYGVKEALARWVNQMMCTTKAKEKQISASVRRFTYGDCRDGALIEFYQLSGTGHTWPGSHFVFPEFLGATDRTVDATTLIIAFFEKSRLKQISN